MIKWLQCHFITLTCNMYFTKYTHVNSQTKNLKKSVIYERYVRLNFNLVSSVHNFISPKAKGTKCPHSSLYTVSLEMFQLYVEMLENRIQRPSFKYVKGSYLARTFTIVHERTSRLSVLFRNHCSILAFVVCCKKSRL